MMTLLLVGSFAFNGRVESAISAFHFSGTATPPLLSSTSVVNPSFVWQSPDRTEFFAVNEMRSAEATVTRFHWAVATRSLRTEGSFLAGGASPCHLTGTARWVAVANYGGGTVRFVSLQGQESSTFLHSGSGPDTKRQAAPHPHGVHLSPDARMVLAPDLGTDEVGIYALPPSDEASASPTRVTALRCPPGSGPRHAAFHPHLPRFYVLTELSNEILVWDFAAGLAHAQAVQQISALPPSFTEKSHAAEILVHASGQWLLASTRGADQIGVWALDARGQASLVGHTPAGGETPRSIALSSDGSILAVGLQDSDRVNFFRFTEGHLALMGGMVAPSPAFVGFFEVPSE